MLVLSLKYVPPRLARPVVVLDDEYEDEVDVSRDELDVVPDEALEKRSRVVVRTTGVVVELSVPLSRTNGRRLVLVVSSVLET